MASESNWVFLRGLMRESRHWYDFPETFEKVVPGGHVYMIDLPGNGMRYDRATPLTIKGIMNDVRNQFLRRSPDMSLPTFILSISLGGMVTAEWLNQNPTEIEGAVLMNTSFSGLSPIFSRLKPNSIVSGVQILSTQENIEREKKILQLTTNLRSDLDEIAEKYAAFASEYPVSLASSARQLLAASRYRLPKQRPDVPILVLTGERDRMVDPSCSHALVNQWNTDFSYHPTAGHDLSLDQPEWVATKIRDWLDNVAPAVVAVEEDDIGPQGHA